MLYIYNTETAETACSQTHRVNQMDGSRQELYAYLDEPIQLATIDVLRMQPTSHETQSHVGVSDGRRSSKLTGASPGSVLVSLAQCRRKPNFCGLVALSSCRVVREVSALALRS